MRTTWVAVSLWWSGTAWAVCGDGVLDPGEACDDLDAIGGDGCSATCQIEPGYVCTDATLALDAVETWVHPDNSHAAALWTTSADLLTAREVQNSQPSVYVTELGADWAAFAVEIEVETTNDDDLVGLVLGFDTGDSTHPAADFLLVDWKQAPQTEVPYGNQTRTAGLVLSRVTGATGTIDLFGHSGTVTELARAATLGQAGWADNVPYRFDVVYRGNTSRSRSTAPSSSTSPATSPSARSAPTRSARRRTASPCCRRCPAASAGATTPTATA